MSEFDPRRHYMREPVDQWMSQLRLELDSARMFRTIVEESAKVGKFPDIEWLREVLCEYERRYANLREEVTDGPA